jgi:hypothetical protein
LTISNYEGDEPLDLELRDKAALVTGGNCGISKTVAWRVDVALVARDRAKLTQRPRKSRAGFVFADMRLLYSLIENRVKAVSVCSRG